MIQEKTRKTIAKISSALFVMGGLLSAFALVSTWLLYKDLPAGVCPIDNNRPYLYVALVLLGVSLLLDLLFGTRKSGPTIPEKIDTTRP